MVWKQVVNADAGDADHFGGDDVDKISQLFSGYSNVDTVDFNSVVKFRQGKLTIANSGNTNVATINNASSGAVTVSIPSTVANNDQFVMNDGTVTDSLYLRANGTKFVSSAIQYYDVPRYSYSTTVPTNDIFYRNRNSANDTNPIASYVRWAFGYSPHQGYMTAYDFTDDLSSATGWTSITGASNIGGDGVGSGVLKLTCVADGTSSRGYYKAVSGGFNTQTWRIRFKIRMTSNSVVGDGGAIFIGASDNAFNQNTSQNFYGMQIKTDVGTVAGKQQFTIHTARATSSIISTVGQGGATSNTNWNMSLNEWYYFEIYRSSGNLYVYNYGKDPQYSKLVGYQTTQYVQDNSTSDVAVSNIKICNTLSATATGTRSYEIDDFKIWTTTNNPTTATPARAVDGTVNGTSYFLSETRSDYAEPPQIILGNYQPIVVEDFKKYQSQEEADYFWIPSQVTPIFAVNLTTDSISGKIRRTGTSDTCVTKVSDWINSARSGFTYLGYNTYNYEIRCKITFTNRQGTSTNNARLYLGVFDSDWNTPSTTSQRFTGWVITTNNTTTNINYLTNNSGAVLSGQDGTNIITASLNQAYYLRLTKTSTSNISYGIYTDANYTQLVSQSTFSQTVTTQINQMNYVGLKNDNTATGYDSAVDFVLENISIVGDTASVYSPPVTGNSTYGGILPRDPIAHLLNLYLPKTTETQFKIRIGRSPAPFFSDADTIRTINVSDYTSVINNQSPAQSANTPRYFPQNKTIAPLEADRYPVYWVQIIGTTNGAQIAINDSSTQAFDDTYWASYQTGGVQMYKTHLHYSFKKTAVDTTFDYY